MVETNCCGGLYINGANVSSEWEQIAPLPKEIYHSSAIAVEGKIYIFGGRDNKRNYLRDVYMYDPLTNQYTQKTNMPVGKSHVDSIAEFNGYIYVVGGLTTSGAASSAHRYNILTDKWEQIANLSAIRFGMTVIEFNGLIYAIGGAQNSGKHVATVEVYNPQSNTWLRKKDIPTHRSYASSFIYDNKIYIAGGWNEIEKKTKDIVEIYDPILDSWSKAASMNKERSSFGITAHNGFYYAFGSFIEKYNPETNSWTLLNCRMPDSVVGFGIADISSSTYIFGGYKSNTGVSNSYKYTPIELDSPIIQLMDKNTLTWESMQGATSYNVYRKISDGACELIAENITDTTFVDTNQLKGNTYHYVVRSVNEKGISCHSNEVSVEVENPPKYKRALLVIRTVNHDWFEYDLTENEINDFVHWYDNVPSEDLKPYYVFDKDFNIGPFQSRKDHIVHNKIVYFEIKEY